MTRFVDDPPPSAPVVAPERQRTARPAHVPEDRVRDVDMYSLPGIERGYHEAWQALQTPDTPDPILSRFARQMTRPQGSTPEEMAADLEAGNKGFDAYVDPVIRRRIGGSGDDLITVMVNSEVNGRRIDHDKAIGLVSLLMLAGLDTVVNFLSFFMIHLGRHPELVAQMRADPIKLMRGTEELFRRFPVVAEARMVARDQEYRGVHLKHGDMILIPTVLHGLDETLNPQALTLNLDRRGISHSTFGGGPHRCAGLHLARMEVTITLEEWFKRIPEFKLADDAAPTYHSGIVAAVENVPLTWNAGAAAVGRDG